MLNRSAVYSFSQILRVKHAIKIQGMPASLETMFQGKHESDRQVGFFFGGEQSANG